MNSLGKKSDLQPETSGLRGPQRHSGSASWQQCLEFPENSQNSLKNKTHVLFQMCRVSREEKDVLWCLLAAHYKLRSSIPIQLHFKILYKYFTLLCIHGPDEWRPGRTPLCSGHTEGLCHETQLGQVSATPAPSSLGGHLESWQKAWEGEGAGNTWTVSPVLSLCSGSFCEEASQGLPHSARRRHTETREARSGPKLLAPGQSLQQPALQGIKWSELPYMLPHSFRPHIWSILLLNASPVAPRHNESQLSLCLIWNTALLTTSEYKVRLKQDRASISLHWAAGGGEHSLHSPQRILTSKQERILRLYTLIP